MFWMLEEERGAEKKSGLNEEEQSGAPYVIMQR
jgi:hypothetical protein